METYMRKTYIIKIFLVKYEMREPIEKKELGVNSRAHDSLDQYSMTNNLYFHTRDTSGSFLLIVYEIVSSNMYIQGVCTPWL